MTKQEEINRILDRLKRGFTSIHDTKVDLVELGVVIKVDRELPEIDFDDVSDIERTRLMNSVSRHTVDILRKAGYAATEPLIHCSSCKKEPCTCPSINRGSFAKYVMVRR